MKLRHLFLFLGYALSIIVVSCNGNSETEKRLKNLEVENQKLREEMATKQGGIDQDKAGGEEAISAPVTYEPSQSRFVFVRLEVSQQDPENSTSGNRVNGNYCSAIKEISYVDEDTKYRLLDEIQSTYLKSPGAIVYHGQVKSRKVFEFDTYQLASKSREKYLISK